MDKQSSFSLTKKIAAWGLFSALFLGSLSAQAAKVYVNGVDIDGVTSQTFKNCTVTIDARGDVFISVKGIQIQAVGSDAPLAAPSASAAPVAPVAPVAPAQGIVQGGPVKMRYWLVTEKTARGMSQYDLDVYINNKFVDRLTSKADIQPIDVTEFMRAGNNTVYIVAKKNTGTDGRLSTSPLHTFKLYIGESATKDGQEVIIDKQVMTYSRNASESQDFTDMYNVTAR